MGHDKNHASEHTNGTDDIQDASDSVKGLVNITTQSLKGIKTFVDGLKSNKRVDIEGSTQQGSVGEEFNCLMNIQDPAAAYPLVFSKGNLPVDKDYIESWCGEDTSGQFGKGFLLWHDKTNKKWFIAYSTSGKMDGTETILFEIDENGNVLTVGNITVANGKTVDGVDLSAHAIDTDAHHAKNHAHDGVDGSGNVSHSDLSDLDTDDHKQYLLRDDVSIKAGTIAHTSFSEAGGVYQAEVTFVTNMPSTNYTVALEISEPYIASVHTKVVSGFTVSLNSGQPPSSAVGWLAVLHGEHQKPAGDGGGEPQ